MGLQCEWPFSILFIAGSVIVMIVGATAERNSNPRTRIVGDALVSVGALGAAAGAVVLASAVLKARHLAALTAAAALEETRVTTPAVALWGLTPAERTQAERWRLLARGGEGFRADAYALRRAHGPAECAAAIGFLTELADGALGGADTGLPPAGRSLVDDARQGCLAWAGARASTVWTPDVEAAFQALAAKLDRAYADPLVLAAQRSGHPRR